MTRSTTKVSYNAHIALSLAVVVIIVSSAPISEAQSISLAAPANARVGSEFEISVAFDTSDVPRRAATLYIQWDSSAITLFDSTSPANAVTVASGGAFVLAPGLAPKVGTAFIQIPLIGRKGLGEPEVADGVILAVKFRALSVGRVNMQLIQDDSGSPSSDFAPYLPRPSINSIEFEVAPSSTNGAGDFNGDGKVDAVDFLALLNGWGTIYNSTHFLELLNNWGVGT